MVSSRALAAIAYTSGSTGEPKGVVTDHREILHRIMLLVNGSRLGPEDRHGLLQSIAVSASYRRVLGPLLVGASVLPFDLRAERADALGPWLIREGITICAFAASVFRHLAGAMSGPASYPAMRRVWLQSEPVVRTDVDLFRRLPGALRSPASPRARPASCGSWSWTPRARSTRTSCRSAIRCRIRT
jgi:acyl-coenzyme A synthetase/AMP-(fatty) acid ligase